MKKIIALMLALACAVSLVACGGKTPAAEPVDLNAVYEECAAYLPEMLILDEATMLNFLGIQSDDCAQAVVAISANGLSADEVWLIEAKDEAAYDRLIQLVNVRLTAKEDETISYVPDQYAIVEKAEILSKDLYIAFLVSPDVDSMKAMVESALN